MQAVHNCVQTSSTTLVVPQCRELSGSGRLGPRSRTLPLSASTNGGARNGADGWDHVRAPLSQAARPRPSLLRHKRASLLQVQASVKKTFKTFNDVIKEAKSPVLVDFYALWCGPCQLMSKTVLPEVSRQMQGVLQVVKIDSEKYPQLASDHGVQALPTLLLFNNGKLLYRFEGAMPADQLVKEIKSALANA